MDIRYKTFFQICSSRLIQCISFCGHELMQIGIHTNTYIHISFQEQPLPAYSIHSAACVLNQNQRVKQRFPLAHSSLVENTLSICQLHSLGYATCTTWHVLFLIFICFVYSLLRHYDIQVLLIFPQLDTDSGFHDCFSLRSTAHLHRLKLIMVDYSRKSETASYLQQMWSQGTVTFGKITSLSHKAMVWVFEWRIKLNQF